MNLSDRDIFPGWDFEATLKESIDKEPVQILQESLDKMTENEKKRFTRQVVRKHTAYGAVSLFKGVEESRFAKKKAEAISFIQDLKSQIDFQEEEISKLEKELQDSRVNMLLTK
jgi:hypothetical protein